MISLRPTIVVLGASGGVARAFLQLLPSSRHTIAGLVLVDKNDAVTRSAYLAHSKLAYTFIQADVNLSLSAILLDVKSKNDYVIVLDLTDQATHPILHAVDFHGINYINCSLNVEVTTMVDYWPTVKEFGRKYQNGSHVIGIGMNPGIVNHMILGAIERYGVPKSFIEIEYDSALPQNDPGTPFVTWSRKQFLGECVIDNSGYCGEGGKCIELEVPPISNPIPTQCHLSSLAVLDEYPLGMIVTHEEIIALSQHFGIPGKFIYAIHPLSLRRLQAIYSERGTVAESDVAEIDNAATHIYGSDRIGAWLNYDEGRVCWWCEVNHKDAIGKNATLFMVAVGVLALLLDYLQEHPGKSGVTGVHDLNTSRLLRTVKQYMNINEIVEDVIPCSNLSGGNVNLYR